MIKKLFKYSYLSIEIVLRLVYFVLGVALIGYLSYLFGHSILDGMYAGAKNELIGNDSTFALSLLYWFGKFYPHIPIWYPIQGMGVSLFYSYPMGSTFLILFIKNFVNLNYIQLFRIMAFTTFPLTAIGIYLLASTRLKNQTIGLIAAVFFLLSQASWLFQTLHGIFAQSFSLIFVSPALIAYDAYLQKFIKGESKKLISRIYLVLAVMALAITFLMHFVTGVMVSITLGLWTFGHILLSEPYGFKLSNLSLKAIKTVTAVGAIGILAVSLSAFWVFPFNSYTKLANADGLNTRDLPALQQESLRIPSMLGIGVLGQGDYRYDFFFFAAPVLTFFAIGLVLSIVLKNKFVIVAGFTALFFAILTTVPIYFPPVASAFKFFFTGVYFRGLIPALILIPLVAAYGVWAMPSILLVPLKNLKIKPIKDALGTIVAVAALVISFWSVKNINHQPPPNSDFNGTYKYQFQAYGPSLNDDFNSYLKKPYIPTKIPQVTLNPNGLETKIVQNQALNEWLKTDNTTILDASPYAAGGALMQGSGILNNSRFVNLYHYYASMIHGMWGYQAGQFYGKEALYKSPVPLGDLSDWFGVRYVVITEGFDPFYKYEAAGWKPTEHKAWGTQIWENPNAQNLFTASAKPAVLVIGDSKKGSYTQVFRTANLGGLPYKDALMVEGSKNIDDYSLSELKNFKGIILHGYSYKSNGAWGTINKYLEEGGQVFVDTGWQFVAKNWGSVEGSSMPEPMPIKKTKWSTIGTDWNGVETSIPDVNLKDFTPPVWDKSAWGMSLANKSDLRDGAKPILWKGDQILMAEMQVGKGKIVWSGMNIFSHVTLQMNDIEGTFMGQILRPMFKGESANYLELKYDRPSPDDAFITFNNASDNSLWFLWREAYTPYTHVTLNSSGKTIKPQVYKAGPGFLLVRLPKVNAGDKLQISIGLNFKDGIFAKTLSVAALVFLIAYLLIGDKIVSKLNRIPVGKFSEKFSSKIGKITNEDEDY